MGRFSAPWSSSLKVTSAMASSILAGVALIGLITGPRDEWIWQLSMVGLPALILLSAVPFLIRGYRIADGELEIQRLGWTTRVSLDGLQSVEVDPRAMERSLRTFGNGGLFCIAGRFRNARLGPYRAWATDPGRAVVLRFPGRTLVVTPDRPQAFADALGAVGQGERASAPERAST